MYPFKREALIREFKLLTSGNHKHESLLIIQKKGNVKNKNKLFQDK